MIETKAAIKPVYYEKQVSAMLEKQQHILAVLAKRTYKIGVNGKCIEAEESIPLNEDFSHYPDNDNLLEHDTDLFAFKPLTDVIIKGKARHKYPVDKFLVQIQVGPHLSEILVQGNRKAYISSEDKLKFTNPELIQEIPLRYDHAYGGCDTEAEKKIILPGPEIIKLLPPGLDILAKSLFRYQRNPAGKGFVVEHNPASFINFELPNLEDPKDLLTTQNLLVGDEKRWHEMPIPKCTDWVDHGSFPRLAYFGIVNIFETKPYQLKEIMNKWADESLLAPKKLSNEFNFRCCNGASLGLQLPYVTRGDQIRLINLHREHSDFIFEIPVEYPKIWIDGRKGKLTETKPVIHTIVIEPDENRLSIVWRGSGPALRPYHAEELKTMPYKVEWHNR